MTVKKVKTDQRLKGRLVLLFCFLNRTAQRSAELRDRHRGVYSANYLHCFTVVYKRYKKCDF